MELLGEVLHFSKSGRLIVKLNKHNTSIRPGVNVSDNQEKKIGKISEIIGPIKSPYASIIPFVPKRNRLTGTKVYINETIRKKHNSKSYTSKSKIKRNKK
jgi:rRNA processing protein Gar1